MEKKEKEELSWEAKVKEQAEEIVQLKAHAAGGGEGGAGQGGGRGQGGGDYGQNGGYQPMGQCKRQGHWTTQGATVWGNGAQGGSLPSQPEERNATAGKIPAGRIPAEWIPAKVLRRRAGEIRPGWRWGIPAISGSANPPYDDGQGAAAGTRQQAGGEIERATTGAIFRGQRGGADGGAGGARWRPQEQRQRRRHCQGQEGLAAEGRASRQWGAGSNERMGQQDRG